VKEQEGQAQKSSSFLKKRTKKLLFASVRASHSSSVNQQIKVFCFFFSKKKYFLPCPSLLVLLP
jgi:hypothetical protein